MLSFGPIASPKQILYRDNMSGAATRQNALNGRIPRHYIYRPNPLLHDTVIAGPSFSHLSLPINTEKCCFSDFLYKDPFL